MSQVSSQAPKPILQAPRSDARHYVLGFEWEDVELPSGDDNIAGRLFLPQSQGRVPVLLIAHELFGFKESYAELVEFLLKKGIAVLALDMHGHGESGGERFSFNLTEWIADIRAAIDFLETHLRIDSNRIIGFGVSSGGTAILETALFDNRMRSIIVLGVTVCNHYGFWTTLGLQFLRGFSKIYRRFAKQTLRISADHELKTMICLSDPAANARWHDTPLVREAFTSIPFPGTADSVLVDTLERAGEIRIPTLILHGAQDTIEPPSVAQLLYDRLTCEKSLQLIPDMGHLGHLDRNREKIFEHAVDWIQTKSADSRILKTPYLYLKLYGRGCLSRGTIQPGMQRFYKNEVGYIAYKLFKHPILAPHGKRIVLSDPICDRRHYALILQSFLKKRASKEISTIFLQASEAFAEILAQYIPEVNQGGIETEIDLNEFTLHGKEKSQLRHWLNIASREKVEVFEEPIGLMDVTKILPISEEWLSRKGYRELDIMTRPVIFLPEEGVRWFWARQNGELIALATFDAMYENNTIVGYYQNAMRTLKKAPHGTTDLICVKAMECFKSEGIRRLSLGISPLCNIHDDHYPHSETAAWIMKKVYLHGSRLYGFKGNSFHKKKYAGLEKKVYFGSTEGNTFGEILTVFKALRLI